MKKVNQRIQKRQSNNEMGFLPADLDRSFFQQRIDKIKALSVIAQCIVLEFETNFTVTQASGPSFGTILENVVNQFENQFKTAALAVPVYYTNSPLGNFFNYAGNLPFLANFFRTICCSRYTINNYSVPFTSLAISAYTENYYGGFNNITQIMIGSSSSQNSYRNCNVGTTGINVDLWKLMNMRTDGVVHSENYVGGMDGHWYLSLTPTEFFSIMRSAITVIKWLESENNAMAIAGNVDGVKVDSYETILSSQLDYINRLSDIVATANMGLINDGQTKKDDLAAKIAAKKVEIETQKIEKRKNIASMTDISTNYSTILEGKKYQITSGLMGK